MSADEPLAPIQIEFWASAHSTPGAIVRELSEALSSLTIEEDYPPVPMQPSDDQLARKAPDLGDRLFLIRGRIRERDIETLEGLRVVASVWADTRIEPFAP